jgi:membrane protein YqaA with SNARE-associated domain
MDPSAPAAAGGQKPFWPRVGSILLRVLALLAVIAVSILIYLFRDSARELASFGYIGIFLLSILANATILLPAPGVAFVFSMGAVFNPLLVALAAGAGASLGELSGYLAGFSGHAVAERSTLVVKLEGWMKKYGGWIILLLGFVPNPFFDVAGVIAGMLKMPLWKFLLFCLIGKTLKMLLFAYSGSLSIPWLAPD